MVTSLTRFIDGLLEANMLQEVLQALREYANGSRNAASLREWIAEHVQAVLNSGDGAAIAIVDELEALFAQLSEGIVTEKAIVDVVCAVLYDAETQVRPIFAPADHDNYVTVITTGAPNVQAERPIRVDRLVEVRA